MANPVEGQTQRGARIVALVPAHNEAAGIGATLSSLTAQTRLVDRLVVIADNCTDDTAGIAAAGGAEVIVTSGNRHKKAGALNQALGELLPTLHPEDAVLVMDADSTLAVEFIDIAERHLAADPGLGAVGGVFYGTSGHGLIGQLQRNEYSRYAREIGRQQGRVMVLTGTASLLRVAALRNVAQFRSADRVGQVYDTNALTEDNELTLALKTLGWRLVSPGGCRVHTDVMSSWRDLWHQRMRWQRGALENLSSYRFTRTTARYWAQQAGLALGVIALQLYLLVMIANLTLGHANVRPIWLVVGAVFVAERLTTVWTTGRRARLVALPILIEMGYDVFLQAVFVRSLFDIATRREAHWGSAARRQLLASQKG